MRLDGAGDGAASGLRARGEEALARSARVRAMAIGEAYSQSFLAFCYGAYGDYARAIGYGSSAWRSAKRSAIALCS